MSREGRIVGSDVLSGASPHRMDTKLRSTYNQLGENHEREAKEIQQTVQIRRHPDVREWRKIDGAGRARTGDHRWLACKMAGGFAACERPGEGISRQRKTGRTRSTDSGV